MSSEVRKEALEALTKAVNFARKWVADGPDVSFASSILHRLEESNFVVLPVEDFERMAEELDEYRKREKKGYS